MYEVQGCSREALGKRVRIVVDNKLKGAFGETDLDTNVIKINKKKHFDKSLKMVNPTGDPYKDLASTVNHELLHIKHPKATETAIRKIEKKQAATMTPKRKKQLLATLRH